MRSNSATRTSRRVESSGGFMRRGNGWRWAHWRCCCWSGRCITGGRGSSGEVSMTRSGGWIGFCVWIVYFLALTGLAVYGAIGFIEVKGDPESWPPLLIVALGLLVGVPLWFLWLLR